jgi:phosphoribosyl 1,2-cyclic phosphate phosphodiesterase
VSLRLTILGCGSSGGVPRIGNNWGACDPHEPRNRRLRCSLLVERLGKDGTTRVLIDTAPDLREQLLASGIGALDAVLWTHEHADHTHGIDELRVVAINMRKRVAAFADDATADMLRTRFGYCFAAPPGSEYPPIITLGRLMAGEPIAIDGKGGPIDAVPFTVLHGSMEVLGFRIGEVAYTPDISGLTEGSQHWLAGLDLWIVDALRHTPHPSHFTLAEALAWIERLKPRRAILTNMHVDLDYATLRRELPAGIEPAYDGLRIEIESSKWHG